MNAQQTRLATIEHRFGLDAAPCGVCGHRPNGNRCQRPEDVADISRRFDEAMKKHMEMTERWRSQLIELGVDPE